MTGEFFWVMAYTLRTGTMWYLGRVKGEAALLSSPDLAIQFDTLQECEEYLFEIRATCPERHRKVVFGLNPISIPTNRA